MSLALRQWIYNFNKYTIKLMRCSK